MNKDFGFACAALAFAVGYYLMADAIPTSLLSDAVGPGGLPKAYGVVLGGLALILLAQALITWRRSSAVAPRAAADSQGDRVHVPRVQLIRVGGMLAIGVIYVLVVPWLGYIVSLTGLITATCYYQGGAVTRQLGLVALAGALFFWLLFVVVLRIPQPPGIWPDLL